MPIDSRTRFWKLVFSREVAHIVNITAMCVFCLSAHQLFGSRQIAVEIALIWMMAIWPGPALLPAYVSIPLSLAVLLPLCVVLAVTEPNIAPYWKANLAWALVLSGCCLVDTYVAYRVSKDLPKSIFLAVLTNLCRFSLLFFGPPTA